MQKKKKKFEFRYNLDSNRDVKDYKNLIKLIKDFLKYTVLRYMQVKKKKVEGKKSYTKFSRIKILFLSYEILIHTVRMLSIGYWFL